MTKAEIDRIVAAYDGHQRWPTYVEDVLIREYAVDLVQKSLLANKFVASKEIASTDIFVQKAENDLQNRSDGMKKNARRCLIAFPANVAFFVFIYILNKKFFQISFTEYYFATQELIRGIVKNATFIGIFLSSQYLIISLYRAFMHESTTLENRVHSLRLGRLFIYLKYSSAKLEDMASIRASVSSSELRDVFGWNIETSTAFKDIDARQVSKSIWSIFSGIAAAIRQKD